MKDYSKGLLRRIAIVTISALIMIPTMPWPVFAADSADAVGVTEAESQAGMVSALPEDNSISNDELLWGYLDEELTKRAANAGESGRIMLKAQRATRGSRLGTYEKMVYDSLKAQIEALVAAEGSEESADTVFTVPAADILGHEIETALIQFEGEDSDPILAYALTAEDLAILENLDGLKVVDAILADMPYEMFWFDKTTQYSCGLISEESWVVADGGSTSEYFPSVPEYAVCLNVAKAYSVDGAIGTTKADLNKLRAVQNAVATADSIISSESGNTDYKKLVHYFNRICNLTSYNDDAMEEPSTPYGDPWQMIYVFDGDPDTNVVCEGYSKAFQYLCDHTAFSNDSIECHTVTGDMRTGVLGNEEHMWNILHMDDGANYIADLTNSDTDSEDEPAIGYAPTDDDPDGSYLFLNGYSGTTLGGGYKFRCSGSTVVTYKYDDDTKALYSSEELALSNSSYVVNEEEPAEPDPAELLESERTAAKTDLENYKSASDYREAQQTELAAAIAAGMTAIDNAADAAGIADALANAKAVIDAIKTDAQLRDEEARAAANVAAQAAPVEIIDLPAAKISKPKAAKKKLTVKWKKVSKKNLKKISGIQIQVATDPGFTNIVKTATAGKKKTSKKIGGLQPKTKYYVRIRAYGAAGHMTNGDKAKRLSPLLYLAKCAADKVKFPR